MTERIPTVGYTDAEAAEGVENIKRRGVAIGHEIAREATQASIGAAFREAKAGAWDDGFRAGRNGHSPYVNPYRGEAGQ